jgi:Ca-activated chloride channel homolog
MLGPSIQLNRNISETSMKVVGNVFGRNAYFITFLLFVIGVFSTQEFSAQDQGTTKKTLNSDSGVTENNEPIIVNTRLITFNVSVTDTNGFAVTGLIKKDFNIFDNKIPQEIHFFSDEDVPVSISIVLDTSGSMTGNKINQAKAALAKFIQTSKEQDEFFLIDVSSKANLLLNSTRNSDALLDKFTYVQPKGNTALFDAVNLGVEKVEGGSHSKKIVLVISDGEDNNSRFNFKDLKKQLKESDAIIYAIGIGGYFSYAPRGLSGRETLKELASVSGGKAYFPENAIEMNDVFDRIALDIRHLYSIGYYPSEFQTNKKNHQITVRVKTPDDSNRLIIHTRKEYIAEVTP